MTVQWNEVAKIDFFFIRENVLAVIRVKSVEVTSLPRGVPSLAVSVMDYNWLSNVFIEKQTP